MKNRILPLALVLGFGVGVTLVRAQGLTTNSGRVGIINIQEAIASTAEGKKAFGDIQTKFRPRQQELQRQQQEIQALQEQLQKQANTLSDDEQRRLSREMEEKQKVFKRATEDADADYRSEGQDVIQRIGRRMVPLINEYAQQSGFALIIDPAAAQVPVYFLSREVDITEAIVKRYDATNPVQADSSVPAPPAGGSASRPAGSTATKPANPAPGDKPKP